MQKEDDRDGSNDQTFLKQSALQRLNRRFNQGRTVIDRHDFRALRQRFLHIGKCYLCIFDHGQRIRPDPLQHNAAGNFALAVQLGDAAPFIGHDLHLGDIDEAQRHARLGHQGDVFNIGHVSQIAAPAHHKFKFGYFDRTAARIHIAVTHRLADIGQSHALSPHPGRIHDDGILFDEATDAGNLRHAVGF